MKRVIGGILCLLLLLTLGISLVPDGPNETETLSLYYPVRPEVLASGGDAIDAIRVDWRDWREQSAQVQAEEVLRLLMGGYKEGGFRQPVPSGTRLLSCTVSGSTVVVDFSSAYGQLSGIDLSMVDYCVALSLVQIPGIYTVRITVNGRDLAYRDKNYFRADDVLVTSPEDVVRNVAVQLHFPNGPLLVPEERILTVYEGESQMEAVLEAVLEGPVSETLQPLVPEDFVVLSVRLEDGTCYLNLPESCVDQLGMGDSTQRQTVIGLVRSLCSVRDVRRVRILVDGEWRDTLGTVDISQPLTAVS